MEVFSITCLMTILWQVLGKSRSPASPNVHTITAPCLLRIQSGAVSGVRRRQQFRNYRGFFEGFLSRHESDDHPSVCAHHPCLIFMGLWLITVYCPVAHAIWHPDGFLYKMDIMDLAGGLVVHLNAGIGSLMCVKVIGNRRLHDNNFKSKGNEPHNILFTVVGCCMMWYGINLDVVLTTDTM